MSPLGKTTIGFAILAAAGILALVAWRWRSGSNPPDKVARQTPVTPPALPPLPPNCCTSQFQVEGQVSSYQAPEKAPNGTAIPDDCRTELFGQLMLAKVTLPPGHYTVEIVGSENTIDQPGLRVFDISLITPRSETAPAQTRETVIAKDVDLFSMADGMGKASIIKAEVDHPGGPMKILFTAKIDSAKFSVIRILDKDGKAAADLMASDMADFLRLPGTPPVVDGPLIWKDPGQTVEARVADLIRHMTLREKVWQLGNNAPSNDRLGLPAYNYWSEALHGVARDGIATVFPQAIGMAASFDAPLLHEVGDTIATEARAKFNGQHLPGDNPDASIFGGLTFWSPNINLFRDPRWGRGQETYGEDPLLTGTMAVAFIQGMQGPDAKYYKVLAAAKHFAVHSGPEIYRHVFDAQPPARDFYESYLPQFEMAVRQGKVGSVMGAYNRVYGSPACDSDLLLKKLLRETWGFDGYVVSDCNAIFDIWANHHAVDNQAQAAAAALKAGCDLECGQQYGSLAAAYELGLIDEKTIDAALARVLTSRFKLGLFDPTGMVPYAQIPASENDTPAHQALSLKMARESIVLLKNDGTLPINRDAVKKIAVIGPNSDSLLALLGNYNGTPSHPVTVAEGIRAAAAGKQIVQIQGCDNAQRGGGWQLLPDICVRPTKDSPETGFKAELLGAKESDPPLATRMQKTIDFHGVVAWMIPGVATLPPVQGLRFSGEFVAPEDGAYKLGVTGSFPYRLTVDGKKVADTYEPPAEGAPLISTVDLDLKTGQAVALILEARPEQGLADVQLLWSRADLTDDMNRKIAERVKDADVILFAGGLDGHMEAEEGDIRAVYENFTGGDRDKIELPAVQTNLMKSLTATGKPVVMINLTGSAVAIPWEAAHVNAIVQAWYPGQAGGTAVAEVLFGDVNPSGRLPVTFYKSTDDLPAFTDYSMGRHAGMNVAGIEVVPASLGRTYRYFSGVPVYAFGHGLSYTTFRYSNMAVSAASVRAAELDLTATGTAAAGPKGSVMVSVDVQNSGKRAGDEVIQVYATPGKDVAGADAKAAGDPHQTLLAFKRVSLAAGQTMHVEIPVALFGLRDWDEAKGAYEIRPRTYTIEVGSSSVDIRAARDLVVQ